MDADSVYALFQGEPAGVLARQFGSMGLAKRVARQYPAAEPARPGFTAPAEVFPWPVAPHRK